MNIYSDSTLASFRTALSAGFVLDGTWEVALSEVVYPSSFNNVIEGKFDFYWPPKKKWAQGCQIAAGRYQTTSEKFLVMEQAIKEKFGSENEKEQFLEYEFKGDMFRPAEGVLFRKISEDLKYILGLRLRPHPLLGNVYVAEYPVDINPFQQVFLYCDCIEPQIVGSVRTMLLRSIPFLHSRQLPSKESGESVGRVVGHANSIIQSFSQLHFKKVSKKLLIDILIELISDTGHRIPFTGTGRTHLSLLFRKNINYLICTLEISKRRVLFHLRWLRFLKSLIGVDKFFREANILSFLVLKMSWQHKRQMNNSQTSRENGFKLTSEEDWQFSGADFNWDLRMRNGRMVRQCKKLRQWNKLLFEVLQTGTCF